MDEDNNKNDGSSAFLWIFIFIAFVFFMSNGFSSEGIQTREEFMNQTKVNSFKTVNYTSEEKEMLVMLVLCEACNEPRNCMVSVAATVLNRAELYECSISDVIAAPGQFDVYCDGLFYLGGVPVNRDYFYDNQISMAESAVDSALLGSDPTNHIGGALYFYSLKGLSEEEKATRINVRKKLKYGDLYFFRDWPES